VREVTRERESSYDTRSEVISFVPSPDFPVSQQRVLGYFTGARQQETNQEQEPGAHPLVGEMPEGEGGPWPRHCWGEVPARCPAVPSALRVCSGSCGSDAYVFVNVVEETAAGVCWSCGDALQSAAFPLAWARLRSAASLALLGVTGKQLISSSGTRFCGTY
jgi:hypothetical protein